jgi:hypothetical protein
MVGAVRLAIPSQLKVSRRKVTCFNTLLPDFHSLGYSLSKVVEDLESLISVFLPAFLDLGCLACHPVGILEERLKR